MNEPDSEKDFGLIPYSSRELALVQGTESHILSQMIESSLALARESAVAHVDLDALVREAKRLYLSKGEGMTAENIRAFNLFYRAAEAGHVKARYWVYRCYRFGHGVAHGDKATYLERLRQSDEAGFARALIQIGVGHHSDKVGYVKDYDEALILYRQAAAIGGPRTGGATACILIGCIYDDRHDYAEALEWKKKAAQLGHIDNIGSVVYAYKDGKAFPDNYVVYLGKEKAPILQSHVEAYKWLRLGIDHGWVTKEELAELTALMPASEVETAQRIYHEFKAKCLPGIPGS